MKVLYGEECADTSTFQHFVAHVPDGKPDQVSLNLSDKQWSRGAWTATDKDHTQKTENKTLMNS